MAFQKLKLSGLILIVAGCATVHKLPPNPAQRFGRSVPQGVSPAAPPLKLSLVWEYPNWNSNIVFEVWNHDSLDPLAQWQLLAVTNCCGMPIDSTSPHNFYIVRARDMSTGLVSDWAR